MMRSMYSGVSGLKTHQIKMDVIGNNIANVNTVAFKSNSVTFSELMYQTTQKASGANALTGTGGTNARQIGLGIKSGAISTAISSQGATQTTGNPFDICITGSSFFVVNDGSQNFFTRAGAFNVDSVGNLVMASNGYNVMGWGVNEEEGIVQQDTVEPLRIMNADKLTYPPEATTLGYLAGILDKNDKDVATEAGKKVSLSFYDNLGYAYVAKYSIHQTVDEGVYYVKLDDVLDSNGKSITEKYPGSTLKDLVSIAKEPDSSTMDGGEFNVKVPHSRVSSADYQATKDAGGAVTGGTIKYKKADSSDGSYALSGAGITTLDKAAIDGGAKEMLMQAYGLKESELADIQEITIDNANGSLNVTKVKVLGSGLVYSTDNGSFQSIAGNADGNFYLNFNTEYTANAGQADAKTYSLENFADIEVNWKATNMYNNSGTSTLNATSGNKDGLGTGRKLGNMSGVTIQTNGMIYASYDNGMTRLLGQIAVAEFTNPEGLEKAGDNLYKASLNSGEFDGIGVDVTGSGGYMTTGVLEMSNVDLSAEFTEMITTQRGFQANSRIISVSDQMLEELVNLKR